MGGKSLPWYMLGLSDARICLISKFYDAIGQAWHSFYGFKSVFIPWLWPVFNQIFLMVFPE